MNVRSWLIHLYPRPWRERYGEEFDVLLEECLHSPLDVVDIFLGALDAHLEFPIETNWRLMNMVNKLRTMLLIVFTGYIGFIIGGLAFYGLVDDSPMALLMKTGTDVPLSAAWVTVEIGAVIALFAVVIGGLPIGWRLLRRALTSSRQDLKLLLVPVLAFLALVLYFAFEFTVYTGRLPITGITQTVSHDNFPIGNRILIGGSMVVLVLGAIASTVAVWKVLAHTEAAENTSTDVEGLPSMKLYKRAFVPAVITTGSMLVMLVGTIIWSGLAYSSMPQVFAEDWGLLQANTTGSMIEIVVIMALSTALAFFGLVRGWSARRSMA
ncbi:MAG: hypothetical protein ABSA51_02165 [Anaerolineaceae bacterium]|jgi:hypothetical protein